MNTMLFVILTYCSQQFGTGSVYYSKCVKTIVECSSNFVGHLPEADVNKCVSKEAGK